MEKEEACSLIETEIRKKLPHLTIVKKSDRVCTVDFRDKELRSSLPPFADFASAGSIRVESNLEAHLPILNFGPSDPSFRELLIPKSCKISSVELQGDHTDINLVCELDSKSICELIELLEKTNSWSRQSLYLRRYSKT